MGNPLLNNNAKSDFNVKRRWDDDVIFKNQARGTDDKKKKEFVNDLLRSDFHKRFMRYVLQNVMRLRTLTGPLANTCVEIGLSYKSCTSAEVGSKRVHVLPQGRAFGSGRALSIGNHFRGRLQLLLTAMEALR